MKIGAVVLAGGKGTRMDSDIPKPLQKLGEKTLLDWTLDKLDYLPLVQKVVVVGWRAEEIIDKTTRMDIEWAVQPRQLGNADALGYGLSKLVSDINTVFMTQVDDSAFYEPETLMRFIESHQSRNALISLMTVEKVDKTPRFRIQKESGFYRGLVKLTDAERGVVSVEFFTGCACFDRDWLQRRIGNISASNEREFSIPALFEMARGEKERIFVHKIENPNEWLGINTKEQLAEARRLIGSKEVG